MDITSIYNHLQHKQYGRKMHKQAKSLAAICSEVLEFSLSKVCPFHFHMFLVSRSLTVLQITFLFASNQY